MSVEYAKHLRCLNQTIKCMSKPVPFGWDEVEASPSYNPQTHRPCKCCGDIYKLNEEERDFIEEGYGEIAQLCDDCAN